jgi:malate dehydrogenase (oxaloacetate-decarboxylating)(NADP+)
VVEARIKRFGLAIKAGRDFDLVNPEDDPRYRSYVQSYIEVAGRRGVTPEAARTVVRTNNTVIAALAVARGEADAMLCGVEGRYMHHLRHVREIIADTLGAVPLDAVKVRESSQGRYLSVTVLARVESRSQLERVYADLRADETVLLYI